MTKITREEYNKALDIVEQYHQQLVLKKADIILFEQKNWTYWEKLGECSVRLKNIILSNPNYNVEDINERTFLPLRNAGRVSWTEFVELRGR